jgi:hypothetical protein
MVEELRKVELVRDRLASLQLLVGSYPEGHDTRVLLENLHLDRALRAVEKDIGALREALIYLAVPEKPPSVRAPGIHAVGWVLARPR